MSNKHKQLTILQAIDDPTLFSPWFKRGLLRGDTWKSWKSFLASLYGLPMNDEACAIFTRHTGRTNAPATGFREAYAIVGRRGGKSQSAATIATYEAVFVDHSDKLAPGETGVVMVIASDRRQARVILNYIGAFFDSIPMLKRMVVSRLKESIELTNRVRIEIHTSSFRAVRGYSILCCVCDELAFWPVEDSASPDTEILNAVRPALLTTNGLLLGISSPYAKRGALWSAYREHYGKDGSEVLVWRASTTEMNATASKTRIAAEYLRDAAAARAEFGAEFRSDLASFVPLEVVERCVIARRFELPPLADVSYLAFVDPSGGSSDSMTLGIAHTERNLAVLDLLREIPAPFSPESAVEEFVGVLRRYRVSEVTGDRYSAEWCAEQFQKRRISYRPSEKNRSELYLEVLPALTSGQCELLDHGKLVAQLCSLDRQTGRGRDIIDHPPGGHDDVANAAAGALVLAAPSEGGVLGLTEFLNSGMAALYLEGLDKVVVAAKRSGEAPESCPSCGDALVHKIAGGQNRCAQCGHQFWPAGREPEKPRGQRGEWLARHDRKLR